MTLESDAVDGVSRHEVALRRASLDAYFREVLVDEYSLQLRVGFERNLDYLGFAIRIGCEVEHTRAWSALSEVVVLAHRHGRNEETLDVSGSVLAVAVHHIIYSTLVVALEHLNVQYVLAHKYLVGSAYHFVLSVLKEHYYVVDVGAVAHKLVLLKACSDESFLSVDVEFLVCLNYLRSLNGVEAAYLGAARMVLAILVAYVFKPVYGYIGHVSEVVLYVGKFSLDACNEFVRLVLVVLQYALHLDFEQSQNVVASDFAVERILHHLLLHYAFSRSLAGRHTEYLVFEGFKFRVDERYNLVLRLRLLEFLLLVYALLNENALQRREEQLLLKFRLANQQFLAQQSHCGVGAVAQHVADGEEARFVVLDDTAVGRDVYLAVGECVQRVDSLVARNARSKMHLYLNFGCRVVIYLLCLDLSLVNSLEYRVDERCGSLRVGYLAYDDGLLVELLYLGAHLNHASTLAVVVFCHVNRSACWEVGIKLEFLATQVVNGSIAYLYEVVWHYLRTQSYGNALSSLSQKQRKLGWQRYRFLVTTVVRELPFGGLRIEHHVESKLREARLDVSWSRSTVAGEYVSPVTLAVYEQVLLSHLHQSVAYRGVAMRMELHGMAHNVCHLVEPAVVHTLHRVEYASLHGFQAILNMRHGTLKYDVRGIVEKPVLIHAAQMMNGRCVKTVHRLVIGMFGWSRRLCRSIVVDSLSVSTFCGVVVRFYVVHLHFFIISYLVVHILPCGFKNFKLGINSVDSQKYEKKVKNQNIMCK